MIEQWRKVPGFPAYEISNYGQVSRVGKTKRTPVKVVKDGEYIYASMSYAPYKSKQVNIRQILDQCFEEHAYKDNSANDLDGEIWRDVVGWEEFYEVSNFGRVRTKQRTRASRSNSEAVVASRIKKAYIDEDGYERVSLYADNKTKLLGVHRVVAEAYIENPDNLPQVNHKNSVKTDNRVENLEWITNTANIQHSIENGKRYPKVKSYPVIRLSDDKHFSSIAELHREVGGSYNEIVHILNTSENKPVCINGQYYKYESDRNLR